MISICMPNSLARSSLERINPFEFHNISYSFDATFIQRLKNIGFLSIKMLLLYHKYSSNILSDPSGGLEINRRGGRGEYGFAWF